MNYNFSWEDSVVWLKNNDEYKELVKFCYYDDPIENACERFLSSEEWKESLSLINLKNGVALDLGAGRGIASYALSKSNFEVYSLEPDPSEIVGNNAIKKISNNLNIKVIESYGEELPFQDSFFDLVYCRAVLHHAKDLNKLIKEIHRVLKTNGVFLAVREHVIRSKEELNLFLENHILHKHYGGENAYYLHEYLNCLRSSGFSSIQKIGPNSSVINFFPKSIKDKESSNFNLFSKKFKYFSFLYNYKVFRKIFINYLDYKNSEPGRHYSFLCKK